ncbi:MAG: hypothetical protein K8S00_01590, partial [Bacteroidales bacterium]|nr:hypothetical protein [Bacteroidales bacterium]
MNDNTRIIKNSFILYVQLIITSIVSLISTRLVLQALGVSDFGLYSIVGGIVVMMGFLNTVMITTTYRYITFEMGKGNSTGVNQVFNICLVIHISLALLLILFAETVGRFYILNYLNVQYSKLDDAMFVFRFSVWGAFFSIICIPFQGLITAQEKFSTRASIKILRSLLRLGVVLIVISFLGNRLRLYSVLMMIVMIIPPSLYYLYCHKKYKHIIRWNFQNNWSKYKEMIVFSGWILLGAGAVVGKVQGTAIIINLFFGTILNASFSIANQVNHLILMFSKSLSQAAIPQITKSFSSGNSERTIQLAFYISKYSFFLMLFPAMLFILETEFILKLWLGEVPQYTSVFINLMIINALIEVTSSGIPAAVHATGRIKWFQIILSIISLLSLPAAYVLFMLGYPPYYILVTYIVSSIVMVIVQLFLLKRLLKFNVKEFLKKTFLRIFYVTISVSPVFFIQN